MSYEDVINEYGKLSLKVDEDGIKVLIGVKNGKLIYKRFTVNVKYGTYLRLGIPEVVEREEVICN